MKGGRIRTAPNHGLPLDLADLAGLIILGAGRGWGETRAPKQRLIADKPVFIGAGDSDSSHLDRAKAAAMDYSRWNADVTLEIWPDTDHMAGWRWYQEETGRGSYLREWLIRHSAKDD